MKTRYVVIAAPLVIALLGAAGAVYAYDNGRSAAIAEGVTIDGIPVGDEGRPGARQAAQRRARTAEPPGRGNYKDRKFTLTPKAAEAGVRHRGSVDAALDASRRGTSSTARGGRHRRQVQRDVPLRVTYSQAAIDRVATRVARKLNRQARDANVNLETGQADLTTPENGLRVRDVTLSRALKAELLDRGSRDADRVRTRSSSRRSPPRSWRRSIRRSSSSTGGRSSSCSTRTSSRPTTTRSRSARSALETPAGLYNVQNKAVNPAWHVPNSDWAGDLAGQMIPAGDPGTRSSPAGSASSTAPASMAPTRSGSIGTAASHGCIRMADPGRRGALRPGSVRGAGRHRLEPDGNRDLLPPLLQQRGVVARVAKSPACR